MDQNSDLNSTDSGEFLTPPDSFSTDQLFNMVAADDAQHANVNNMTSMQQQPLVIGSDHSGDGSVVGGISGEPEKKKQLFVFGSDHSGDHGSMVGGISSTEPEKKKRGRPRIHTLLHGKEVAVGGGNSEAVDDGSGVIDLDSYKRERGRPTSSLKKQMVALGAPGVGFTPHVIMVEEGDDIASKIVSFAESGRRTVCILSATGLVSSVTLQQSPILGGAATYEGIFEIISLSGSFVRSESDDTINASGLSVALACSDGRLLGGAIRGTMVAASPTQIIVGSFVKETTKPKASSESSDSSGSSLDMPPPRYPNFGWPSSVSNMPPN